MKKIFNRFNLFRDKENKGHNLFSPSGEVVTIVIAIIIIWIISLLLNYGT